MRHKGLAEDLLGKPRHLGPILRQLDAARLPAAPCMDLGLHDIHRRLQLGDPFLSRTDVLDLFSFGYGDTELREQLLRLELMNVHDGPFESVDARSGLRFLFWCNRETTSAR